MKAKIHGLLLLTALIACFATTNVFANSRGFTSMAWAPARYELEIAQAWENKLTTTLGGSHSLAKGTKRS